MRWPCCSIHSFTGRTNPTLWQAAGSRHFAPVHGAARARGRPQRHDPTVVVYQTVIPFNPLPLQNYNIGIYLTWWRHWVCPRNGVLQTVWHYAYFIPQRTMPCAKQGDLILPVNTWSQEKLLLKLITENSEIVFYFWYWKTTYRFLICELMRIFFYYVEFS